MLRAQAEEVKAREGPVGEGSGREAGELWWVGFFSSLGFWVVVWFSVVTGGLVLGLRGCVLGVRLGALNFHQLRGLEFCGGGEVGAFGFGEESRKNWYFMACGMCSWAHFFAGFRAGF